VQRFDLSRSSLAQGECVELSWEILGDLREVQVKRANLLIHTSAMSVASIEDCPTVNGIVPYSLTAIGPGGSEIQERQLVVEEPGSTVPPVPPQSAPQIVSFDVANPVLAAGDCTDIFWEIRGEITESALYRNNELIDPDMSLMVRQLQPTDSGLPIEIYAFSRVQEWAPYENIQSDIFDHILAAVTLFDLQVFQNPTGNDFRELKS